jgi:hypothetical protein
MEIEAGRHADKELFNKTLRALNEKFEFGPL